MSEYAKLAADAGDKYLAALAVTQENILKFMRASRRMAPTPPWFSKMYGSSQSPKTVIDATFSFAEKMLEQQEEFVVEALASRARGFESHSAPAPSPTKTTAKPATKKTPTKPAASKAPASGSTSSKSTTGGASSAGTTASKS